MPFVGELGPATVTVYGPAPEPATPVTENPVAVPVSEKSAAVSPVTGRLNVSVYVTVAAFVAVALGAKEDGENALPTIASDHGAPLSDTVAGVMAVSAPPLIAA